MKKDIRNRFKNMSNNPEFKEFEDFPGLLLWQLQHLWQRRLNTTLEPYKITHMQFLMLSALEIYLSTGMEATQANFAKALKFDIMMTSNVLRKLEERKFITRETNPSDTRSMLLDITLEGRTIVKNTRKIVDKFNNEFFGSIGDDLKVFIQSMLGLINSNYEEKVVKNKPETI